MTDFPRVQGNPGGDPAAAEYTIIGKDTSANAIRRYTRPPDLRQRAAGVDASGARSRHDTELRGFCLAVGMTCRTYYASCEYRGRLIRRRVGGDDVLTAAEARNKARAMLALMGLRVSCGAMADALLRRRLELDGPTLLP